MKQAGEQLPGPGVQRSRKELFPGDGNITLIENVKQMVTCQKRKELHPFIARKSYISKAGFCFVF